MGKQSNGINTATRKSKHSQHEREMDPTTDTLISVACSSRIFVRERCGEVDANNRDADSSKLLLAKPGAGASLVDVVANQKVGHGMVTGTSDRVFIDN